MNLRTSARKKDHERFLVECFVRTSGIALNIIDECEPPDFIVEFEGRRIGLEVTELFIEPDGGFKSMQARESIASRIVWKARAIYLASGAPPAHVSVCFAPGADLNSLNRDATASALASFIVERKLGVWDRISWRPEDGDNTLPDEIAFIHALGVPSHDMAHWAAPRAGWAAPLTDSIVQSRIDQKALRLPHYCKVIPENWLLMVADRTRPSQLFDLGDRLNLQGIRSPFARTFFFGYPEDSVIEFGDQ